METIQLLFCLNLLSHLHGNYPIRILSQFSCNIIL